MNSLYAILLLIPLSLPGQFFRRDGEPAKPAEQANPNIKDRKSTRLNSSHQCGR